jgi:hypothetical protein
MPRRARATAILLTTTNSPAKVQAMAPPVRIACARANAVHARTMIATTPLRPTCLPAPGTAIGPPPLPNPSVPAHLRPDQPEPTAERWPPPSPWRMSRDPFVGLSGHSSGRGSTDCPRRARPSMMRRKSSGDSCSMEPNVTIRRCWRAAADHRDRPCCGTVARMRPAPKVQPPNASHHPSVERCSGGVASGPGSRRIRRPRVTTSGTGGANRALSGSTCPRVPSVGSERPCHSPAPGPSELRYAVTAGQRGAPSVPLP